MIRYDDNALSAINTYLATLDRIQREHRELEMQNFFYKHPGEECGTVCCVAGWGAVFEKGRVPSARLEHSLLRAAQDFSSKIAGALTGRGERPGFYFGQHKAVWQTLFGAHRGTVGDYSITGMLRLRQVRRKRSQAETMASLNKVGNWYKCRIERMREWEANNRKPRRERVDHMPSALEAMPEVAE